MAKRTKSSGVSHDAATTIVGGQPPGRKHVRVHVPVGVERVLYLAATDAAFREELLMERDGAVTARGFALRESELAMIRLAPAVQLERAIDGLDTSPENLGRRTFMKAVAASAVTLAAASGCGDDSNGVKDVGVDVPVSYPDAGVPPDYLATEAPIANIDAGVPPHDVRVDVPVANVDAGIPPDWEVPVDVKVGAVDAGILPDSKK